MRQIDAEYRRRSGLNDSAMYKLFYSRIDPAPLLVIGINPGGDPSKPDSLLSASTAFFENYEHDYVDCSYAIQRAMLPFLQSILGATTDQIRRIPKTNLAFRHSPGEDDFKKIHGMTLNDGMLEAKPELEKIICHVQPSMILLETMKPERFASLFGRNKWESAEQIAHDLHAIHRGKQVRAFVARKLPLTCLGRSIPIVSIGHPSSGSFSKPDVWNSITKATRRVCEDFSVCFQ